MPSGLSFEPGDLKGDIAVFFTHGARQSGDKWAVGAQTQPDADLLGMITLAGRGQDDAANAAVKWIRDHCAANDLELVRVENLTDRYAEDQRTDFSLTRFTIARTEAPALDGWTLPRGLPSAASRATRRAPSMHRKAAWAAVCPPNRPRVPCVSPESWSEGVKQGRHAGVATLLHTLPQVETLLRV
ncbi:hypothetical protein ABZ915_43665 [Streptomyces sp. NPDC046915]|uniref:hypothetical protein n=1 Tax=Streptomyces sp. NPDC046915 TaxID=3155257 RepID=UPI003405D90F